MSDPNHPGSQSPHHERSGQLPPPLPVLTADGASGHQEPCPGIAPPVKRICQGRIRVQRVPGHHQRQHHRHQDVGPSGQPQGESDGPGDSPLWVPGLFAGGRDDIEAHKGVEAGGRASHDARQPVWGKATLLGAPVPRLREDKAHDENEEDDTHADGREDVVEPGGHFGPEGDEGGGYQQDGSCQKVGVAGQEWHLPGAHMGLGEVLYLVVEDGVQVAAPGPGHCGSPNHVLQQYVPADEEGPDLTHRHVGEHVGRARLGYPGSKLGVAESSQE